MQNKFGGERFSVVGLMQGPETTASDFVRNQGVNYPVLAGNGDFGAYNILFVPVTYLVDPNGMIVTDDLDEAEAILAKELGA